VLVGSRNLFMTPALKTTKTAINNGYYDWNLNFWSDRFLLLRNYRGTIIKRISSRSMSI